MIIKIFEKKPIAILQKKKERFYLSEKIVIIKFENLHIYKDLPIIFGNEKDFQIFYYNLKKVNFHLESIKKYYFFESNRWDLITQDEKTIKLPSINYIESLKNFLDIKYRKKFKKYKIFDYKLMTNYFKMNANILKPRLFIEIYFKQFVFIVAKIDRKK